jgi:hypothetical protein
MSDSLPASLSAFEQALRRPPRVARLSREQKIGANLGITAFLVVATALGMAQNGQIDSSHIKFWRSFAAPIGMFQWWGVFGDVRKVNMYSTALIEFEDGTTKYYEFPRPATMGYFDKFRRAPEGVFFNEHMANLSNRKVLPSIARYLARANFDPVNKPRKITFSVLSALIDDPRDPHRHYRDELPNQTFRQIYFVYLVSPQDFR